MAAVGIIANPASGKDIRRLVAYGITFDNLEKVNIVRRVLLGLSVAGVEQVIYMPDYYGIVPRAVDGLPNDCQLPMKIIKADVEMTGTQEDSSRAALYMSDYGVTCIITLGGDGTNRMVAKNCGDVPLIPVSTGTNNVFPEMLEGTIAGLAAGAVAQGLVVAPPAVYRSKKIVICKNGQPLDLALIDAVVLKDTFIGSRAVWDEKRIRQVVVTRGEPDNIGISSIAGNLEPIGVADSRGMLINIGSGPFNIMVPIAPGLIRPVNVSNYRMLEIGEESALIDGPAVIALDGEREIEVGEEDRMSIRLTFDGPRVVNAKQTLREAVNKGYSHIKNTEYWNQVKGEV